MEAIGAGASVLAFAGFALEGTKFLYKAATGFKHAPQEVAALVSTVARLRDNLAQICSSRALNDPDVDAGHITALLDACNRDIASFGQDLRRVQSHSADSALLQTWKKFKATLNEDRLISMRNRLDHHSAVLQLELTRLQSTITLDCRDGIRGLQDTATAESLLVSTLVQNVQVVKSSIGHQGDRIQNLQDTATAGDSRISTLIQDVRSIKSSMEDQMQNMTLSTTSTIERHAVVSSSELNTISIAVKALQDQISALPEQVGVAQRASVSSKEHFGPRSKSLNAIHEDLELGGSLERLRQLSSCDPRTFQDEEADAIMEDLECLLTALSQADRDASLGPLIPAENAVKPGNVITSREMKRIRGLISAATGVEVNQSPSRSSVVGSKRIMQQHKVREIVLQNYTMTVTMNKRKIQWSGSQNARQHPARDQFEEEFYATIKAIIGGAHSPSVIVAHMRQIQHQNGFSSLHPVISVGRVLPLDSPIFDIVSGGDVDELREFLAHGYGTLRDRNLYGTPLLHYAARENYKPSNLQMCKFLIEHGADVDEIAILPLLWISSHTGGFDDGTPLQQATFAILQEGTEDRMALINLFLAAGADPTDILMAIVDNPLPFVELNEPGSADAVILLEVAWSAVSDDRRAIINQLLTKGADITACNKFGENCLRLLLENIYWCSGRPCDDPGNLPMAKPIHQSLALLVGKGADVSNIDHFGISVSAFAYGDYNRRYQCAYAGDLWDAVLSQYGHDIRQLRQGFHRLPFYRYGHIPAEYVEDDDFRDGNFRYDRNDIELLWKGREIDCPYYHDPPVWCPYSTSESGECPYGGTGHICPGPDGMPEQAPCRCICCVPEDENHSDYTGESDDEDSYDDEESSHGRIQEVEEYETDDMYGDNEPPSDSQGLSNSSKQTSRTPQPVPLHPRRRSL